ncbi:MAG: N-acetyltransferase [Ilumatobacter sp.]|nr:N-acetyltransferase [Ilumatobacter sp.]
MARRPFRIETERLTIRMLAREDVTAFVHYRKLPAVYQYQDWPVPYTRDLAHELTDEMEVAHGPTPGRWVQLAIDAGDGLVGDVAVFLDDAGTFATIGFTIDPRHQGHGYAVEAAAGVIGWLFRRRRVHRIAATIDPRNVASARVLEACGFEYVGTARSAAFQRGEWTDDARFSLLEADWKDWQRRPTGPPRTVRLVEVTDANLRTVSRLDRGFSQRDFVAPVSISLAQALIPPIDDGAPLQPWYRAVEADGEIVGFVMLAEPAGRQPHPYLWRLLIDRRHQRRGIGERVVLDIARRRREAGATHLDVSYVPLPAVGSPEPFYRRLGFVPTGEIDDGEVEARLDLTTIDLR